MMTRTPASKEFTTKYMSAYGAALHAVKFRPEIAAAMSLLGACLTFPTEELYQCLLRVMVYLGRNDQLGITYSCHAPNAKELVCYADSNWSTMRSTTGFVIFLAGAAISFVSRRQHCITMSSCEAELVALADCAIELIFIKEVLEFIGNKFDGPIKCYTDNKAAFDLCHRFNSAQNSRHIDRKQFKMRELRGQGVVQVLKVHTDDNPADLFTKVLKGPAFIKHRRTCMNLPGDIGQDRMTGSSQRESGNVPARSVLARA